MCRKRSTLLVMFCMTTAVSCLTAAATAGELIAEHRALAVRAYPLIGADYEVTQGEAAFGSTDPIPADRDFWEIGNTWYDYQHNCSQGKQIAVGEDGTIHICWMKGYESGASTRHAVYACYQDGTIFGPQQADNEARSGYCTIAVLHGELAEEQGAVVAFHQNPGPGLLSTVSPDYGSCWLAFLPFNHPHDDDAPVWPHIATDVNNKAHVVATRQADGAQYDATIDFSTWETPGWIPIPTARNTSTTIVASQFDEQVAILTHNHLSLHPDEDGLIFSQMNNDVIVYLSADGDFTDWAEVDSINVTDMLYPETTGHPLPGHVYTYCDIDGLFDTDGNLHIAYTTRPYWRDTTLIDEELADEDYFERWARTGQVWHAMIGAVDQEIEFSHIAGYVGYNNEDADTFASYFDGNPGGWGSLNDRPSLAVDPQDNALYCMWRNFTNHPDTSVAGFSNADLRVRSSCDYGMTWGTAYNITDTATPACPAGDCASEAWGTMAELVYDERLHVEYVQDRDAGAIVQEEGTWTDNPVFYQTVATDDVPCGDPWNDAPHATCLTGTAWNWGALEDGSYTITDFIHLLNESREPVVLETIELLYHEVLPEIEVVQLNGELGDPISPYQTALYQYSWNAVIDDGRYDAVVRFHTNGGTVDFILANRNELDLETAQSEIWFDSVPVGATPRGCPDDIHLDQNYPNPFNPTTTIEFTLATPGEVELAVYNTIGQKVYTLAHGVVHTAGTHQLVFDASNLPSGVYIYRLSSADQVVAKKMLLVR